MAAWYIIWAPISPRQTVPPNPKSSKAAVHRCRRERGARGLTPPFRSGPSSSSLTPPSRSGPSSSSLRARPPCWRRRARRARAPPSRGHHLCRQRRGARSGPSFRSLHARLQRRRLRACRGWPPPSRTCRHHRRRGEGNKRRGHSGKTSVKVNLSPILGRLILGYGHAVDSVCYKVWLGRSVGWFWFEHVPDFGRGKSNLDYCVS